MNQNVRRGKRGAWTIGAILASSLLLAGCGSSPQDQVGAAKKSYDSHNYQAAEVQLKSLLQKHRGDGKAWLLLGKVSLAQRRFDDAIHQFQEAEKAGVSKSDVRIPLAQALVLEQKYDDALNVLGAGGNAPAGQSSARTDAEIDTLRGLALLGEKKRDAAHVALDQALKQSPGFPPALRARARVALAENKPAAAQADLERVIAENQRDFEAQALLGQIDYQSNDCGAAIAPLSAAFDTGGSAALGATEARTSGAMLADCQFRVGEHAAAEKTIKSLLAANSNDPAANYLQSLVDISHGNFDAAANHVQATLNAAPNNLRSMTLMAWINLVQGHPDSARPYLDRVLARSPGDALALRLRASMMIANNHDDQALALVKNAYQQDPDAPGIRDTMASVTAWVHNHRASSSPNNGNIDMQIALARSMLGLDSPAAALAVLDQIKPTTASGRDQIETARIEILLASNEADKAIDAAKKLVAASPSLDTRLLLARAYVQAEKYQKAQAVVDDIKHAEGGSGDERVVRLEAAIALAQGQDRAAVPLLEKLAKAHPDDANIARQLTYAYLQTGQRQQAVATLSSLAKAKPKNEALQQQLAHLYLQLGDTKSAASIIQPHLAASPDDAAWLVLDGESELAAGQTDQGLASIEKANQVSNDPRIALTLAQARLANGRIKPAFDQLQSLVEQNPQFWEARSLLGETALDQGQPAVAKAQVDALQKGGQGYLADLLAGDIARHAKNYKQADARYEAAYKTKPSAGLAVARFDTRRQGNLSDPAAPLVAWLDKAPASTGVALQLGSWYQSQNDNAKAEKVYQRLLSTQPNNPVALNNLAILIASKDPAQAIAYARNAHKIAPEAAAIDDTLGWLLWQQGQHEQGLSLLTDAYRAAGKQSAEIAYHYGVARAQSKNSNGPSARQALEAALKQGLDPAEESQAHQVLDSLSGSS